jgi:hypothetical protein
MCKPLDRMVDTISLFVIAVDGITNMETDDPTAPTDDGENTNTTFTNTAFAPTLDSATVEEIGSNSPDVVKTAILSVLEIIQTMSTRDMDDLLAAGLCLAVVQAMNQHCDEMELQFKACVLLANLAFKSNEIAVDIIQWGGDVAIVNVMKRFPLVEEIQHLACVTLNNVLVTTHEDGGRYESVMAAGGIPALIAAMNNFPQDTQIGLFACFCLSKLTESSLENTKLAVENGVVETVAGVVSASQDANDDRLEVLAVILIMRFMQHHEKENLPRAVDPANE